MFYKVRGTLGSSSLDSQFPICSDVEVIEAKNTGVFVTSYLLPADIDTFSTSYGYLGFKKQASVKIR